MLWHPSTQHLLLEAALAKSHERRGLPLVERDDGGQPTHWSLLHRARTCHYSLYSNCRNVVGNCTRRGATSDRFFLHARRLVYRCSKRWRSQGELEVDGTAFVPEVVRLRPLWENMDTEASPHTSSNLYKHWFFFAVLWAWRSPFWFRRTSASGSLQNVPASLPHVLFLCCVGCNAWFRRVRCAVAMRHESTNNFW